jgi:Protein of unknown function (DUF1344)
MKKVILALAVATLFSGAALAKDMTGVVKEYNKDTGVLTLEDGTSYTIPKEVAVAPEVAAGAKVTVTVDDADATKVTGVMVSAM